jgi:hypothetical protein
LATAPQFLQNGRGAEGAEAALARPHAQPHVAAQVVQRDRWVPGGGLLQHGARDQFALADQVALQVMLLHLVQAMAEPVVALLHARHDGVGGAAGRSTPICWHAMSIVVSPPSAGRWSTCRR